MNAAVEIQVGAVFFNEIGCDEIVQYAIFRYPNMRCGLVGRAELALLIGAGEPENHFGGDCSISVVTRIGAGVDVTQNNF